MPETSALNTTPQPAPPTETRTKTEETRTQSDKPKQRDAIKKETVVDKIGQRTQAEAAVFHKDKLVVEKEEPPSQPKTNDISSREATATTTRENLNPLPEVQPQAPPPTEAPVQAADQGTPPDAAVAPPDSTTAVRDTIETAVAQREQEQAFENAAEAGVEEVEARPPAKPTQQQAPQPNDKAQVRAQERADSAEQNKPVADREIGGTVDVAI